MNLLDWLDDRTAFRKLVRGALYEHVPGGARWRYVWGSTLTFAITVQIITGFVLWMNYSAGAQSAWESVYYIQNEMQLGWLLRGIHHFTAQAMIVLLALHLMQVVIDGAYKAPREVNFWLGLILMQIVLGLSLTGYLLPWDQKGYWATQVATSLIGAMPGGPWLKRALIGGACAVGAYGIALWAMTRAPIAVVAVLRETAVIFGAVIAYFVLHEKLTRRRLAATGAVMLGLAALRF